MIESNYFKIALICLGSIIILSNFINFQSFIYFLLGLFLEYNIALSARYQENF